MEAKVEKYNNHSIINVVRTRVRVMEIHANESTITIDGSQLDLTIRGFMNRIKIEESAGRLNLVGRSNQVEIKKSWISCEVVGDNNVFGILQS